MEELIPISDIDGKKAVNARHLHAFLESKQDFSDWIKNRIKKYDFIENQDFEVFHNFMENPSGGRPLTEYALTLSCAKEIAMVEGNDKGKQARQYFITCETFLKNLARNELYASKKKISVLKEKSIQIKEIDNSINGLMKRRRGLIKEMNVIIRSDSTQLLLFSDMDNKPTGNFPNKSTV